MDGNTQVAVDADSTFDRDWLTLFACATGLLFSVGALTIYPLGVFIAPLGREFGWTRGQISGAATFGQLSLVASSLLWGVIFDRVGPRRALLAAVVGLAVGLALLSRLTGPLWHLDVLFAAIPLLAAAANPLGYNGVLVRRFSHRLGLALGIALMGLLDLVPHCFRRSHSTSLRGRVGAQHTPPWPRWRCWSACRLLWWLPARYAIP